MKYYWMSYQSARSLATSVGDIVTTVHPFEFVGEIKLKYGDDTSVAIVNYKEITREEYKLFLDKRKF